MSIAARKQAIIELLNEIAHDKAVLNILQHRAKFSVMPSLSRDILNRVIQEQVSDIEFKKRWGRQQLFDLMISGISHRAYLRFIRSFPA